MRIVFALLLMIPLMACSKATEKIGQGFGVMDKQISKVTGG